MYSKRFYSFIFMLCAYATTLYAAPHKYGERKKEPCPTYLLLNCGIGPDTRWSRYVDIDTSSWMPLTSCHVGFKKLTSSRLMIRAECRNDYGSLGNHDPREINIVQKVSASPFTHTKGKLFDMELNAAIGGVLFYNNHLNKESFKVFALFLAAKSSIHALQRINTLNLLVDLNSFLFGMSGSFLSRSEKWILELHGGIYPLIRHNGEHKIFGDFKLEKRIHLDVGCQVYYTLSEHLLLGIDISCAYHMNTAKPDAANKLPSNVCKRGVQISIGYLY